jgi:hypothetical protein
MNMRMNVFHGLIRRIIAVIETEVRLLWIAGWQGSRGNNN